MKPDSNGYHEVIDDEAIAWFVRMRGSEAAALRSEFDEWMRLGDDRKAAYERTARLFDEAALLKYSSSPLAAPRQHPELFRPERRTVFALAAAAVLSASLGLAIWKIGPAPIANETSTSTLITARGQIRTFRLAGGASVTLDTASELRIVDPEKRHLRIIAGRARVAVSEGQPPVIVDAGAGRVSLRSGAFDVSLGSNKIAIALLRGRADATAVDRSAIAGLIRPARSLGANEVLTYSSRSFVDAVATPAPGRSAGSWPTGWAEYRSIPLAELIAQANRYASTPIVLDDRAMVRRAVAGRFHLAETMAFTKRLADLYDLDIVRDEKAIHLRPR